MYFVPLSQMESVELLIHSLKAAGGQADCTTCPAHKVCMHQCLMIAKSVEQMLENGTLPQMGAGFPGGPGPNDDTDPPKGGKKPVNKAGLRIVK